MCVLLPVSLKQDADYGLESGGVCRSSGRTRIRPGQGSLVRVSETLRDQTQPGPLQSIVVRMREGTQDSP